MPYTQKNSGVGGGWKTIEKTEEGLDTMCGGGHEKNEGGGGGTLPMKFLLCIFQTLHWV